MKILIEGFLLKKPTTTTGYLSFYKSHIHLLNGYDFKVFFDNGYLVTIEVKESDFNEMYEIMNGVITDGD